LHGAPNIEPIQGIINGLTGKHFANCPSHPKPLVQHLGNYTVDDEDPINTKQKHTRPQNILQSPANHNGVSNNFIDVTFIYIYLNLFYSLIFVQIGCVQYFVAFLSTYCKYCA
jgi:hypothetical protein